MSYVDSSLTPGEQVVYRAKLHWNIYVKALGVTVAGYILAPLFVIGLIMLVAAAMRQQATEMAVTSKRVIMKTGVFSTKTLELNLAKIENVGVEQGMFGSLLNYGTVTLVGTGGSREKFRGVFAPLILRRAVQHATDNNQQLVRAA